MPPFLCAISHFSKKYHNQVALAKRPFVAGHTEDKYTGCDVFAEKASYKCRKISITMFVMTLKMTVMLLSSRYRREIKDSKKWLLCRLRIRLEQLAKMTTASLLSRRGLRQAATRIMIRSKNTTERSTNTIRPL